MHKPPHLLTRSPFLVGPRAPAERPIRKPPHGPEHRVVYHGKQDLGRALGPGCSVDAGERQPAGPPHAPGEQPQRRAHGGLFRRPAPFPTQEAKNRAGPHAVGEVRCYG